MLTDFPSLGVLSSSHAPFLLCALLICAAYVILCQKSAVQKLPLPPAAEKYFGHERLVLTNSPGKFFREWATRLGLTYRIKASFWARDVLILCDPVGIAHMLKGYDYHHSEVSRPRIERFLGRGIGWVEGEREHKRMRQMISPVLSHDNVKAMSANVREAVTEVVDRMTQYISSEGSGVRINLFQWTGKANLAVVGRAVFLHDFEGGESVEAQKILGARRKGVSQSVTYRALVLLMLLRHFPILNRLPLKGIQGQSLAKQTIQAGVAEELVRRDHAVLAGTKVGSQKDVLTRLLLAHESGAIATSELYDQISTVIISGNETTTQTLAFALWELALSCVKIV